MNYCTMFAAKHWHLLRGGSKLCFLKFLSKYSYTISNRLPTCFYKLFSVKHPVRAFSKSEVLYTLRVGTFLRFNCENDKTTASNCAERFFPSIYLPRTHPPAQTSERHVEYYSQSGMFYFQLLADRN